MSRPNRILLAAAGTAAAVALLGPRVRADETVKPRAIPSAPADLDRYLATSEAAVPDITPGAEKIIVWANPDAPAKTPLAIVYLHGFSATRQETAPLSDSVAAELGANLYYTRLVGHGVPGKQMATATANDWINDTAEAIEIGRRIGERVVLIGTSTGGTLGLWAATRPEYVADIEALILISPNLWPKGRGAGAVLLPWGHLLARALLGADRSWEPANPQQAKFWTTKYPTRAILPMMALVQMVRKKPLEELTTPVLVEYSELDQVVDVKEALEAYKRIGSPRKEIFNVGDVEDSHDHVIAGKILSPHNTRPMAERIVRFVRGE